MRQLTFGGENVAARWAWAGDQVVLQSRDRGCPHVTRVTLTDPPARTVLTDLGDGESPAFLPGDRDVVYASSPSCAKRPERAEGLALDPALDVYRAGADGSSPKRLTETPGYDAEASVCGKTGAVVFTSTRDGDLDLYRMDADGSHVERLTATSGYDGGAVFDADCSHIAWHAWHPRGKELDDYKKQLDEHLLRPSTLELWIANADGTDARQVTYLDARSSAPSWYPSQARLLFTSTFGGENAARRRPLGDRSGRHEPRARHHGAGTRFLRGLLARRQVRRLHLRPRHAARARRTPTSSSRAGEERGVTSRSDPPTT